MKIVGKCPICSAEYKTEHARLFAKKESANLVHICCGKCQSSMLFMIMIMGQGLSSVGMVTDLSFEDASRLYSAREITLDEVLEGHDLINTDQFIFEVKK